MHIARKDKVKKPRENPTGERIYEMIGRGKELGEATRHSFAYVVIPPNCSSQLHYHPEDEETYYILKGEARLIINGKEYNVCQGDAILINPPERHRIFANGNEDLEFVVVCAPAWKPTNSVFLDE
jgi:mannose-6-phosphate isomerase-like protein (cupin superfamily)